MTDIYLDYNGSTPIDPRVGEVVQEVYQTAIGNASAGHHLGSRAAEMVETARLQVSELIGNTPSCVRFTSGATEANNLVLQGIAEGERKERSRFLISAVEHPSVWLPAQKLTEAGKVQLEQIPVNQGGRVELSRLEEMMSEEVTLVSVVAANSETGVINPVQEAAKIAHRFGAVFHCDATQAWGRIAFDMTALGLDLVSLSGHKMNGPGGVGVLAGTKASLRKLRPALWGGGQEKGLRPGSLNVAGIVGLGRAAELVQVERAAEASRTAHLRTRFIRNLQAGLSDISENGDLRYRLPNTSNLLIKNVDAQALVAAVYPVAISAGTACHAGTPEPSPTLLAMGLSPLEADQSVRVSLGRFTTTEEIDQASDILIEEAERLRRIDS